MTSSIVYAGFVCFLLFSFNVADVSDVTDTDNDIESPNSGLLESLGESMTTLIRNTNITAAIADATSGLYTSDSNRVTIGVLQAPGIPSQENVKYILQMLSDDNTTFSSVNIEDFDKLDIADIKSALRNLMAVRPAALIGPFSEAYAIAAEELRIPYIMTSLTPKGQPESPFLIRLFPGASDFAMATVDLLNYYHLDRAVVFHDCDAGKIILETLAQQTLLVVSGYAVTTENLYTVREQLKLAREHYFTTFISVLSPNSTVHLLDQALSLSMFSGPNNWLLINVGVEEYSLDQYADSYANLTVLRQMMDYTSNSCGLALDEINLKLSAFHDAVLLYVRLRSSQRTYLEAKNLTSISPWINMRRVVNKVRTDGCTGQLKFTRLGRRTETYLQLMTLQGYRSGTEFEDTPTSSHPTLVDSHGEIFPKSPGFNWFQILSGTWRSRPTELDKRVSPSKTYSVVSRLAAKEIRGKFLRITAILEPGFFQIRTDKNSYNDGHPLYEGFCVDILMELQRMLGFRYNITLSHKYGSLKSFGWTGMVGMLVNDTADVAIAGFQMSTDRARVVDFTKPFMTKGTTVVIKRPEEKIWMFQFLSPLSNEVWVAIFLAFVIVSLVLFGVSRANSDKQAKYTSNLRESFWYIWGTLLRGSLTGSPHAISSRIVSSAWWFFCLIISSIYTANLAAFLTITIGDIGMDSAADLALQDTFKYGTVEGSQTEKFFKHTEMTYYSKMWAQMSIYEPSSIVRRVENGFERVRKGKYAFIWDSPTIRYEISNDCDLMEIGSPFDLKGYGFAYQKGAPYGESISWALLRLNDEGVLYRLERKWWRPQFCPDQKQSAQTKSLDLETVAGMYVIIGGGAVISSILCLLNYCWSETRTRKKTITKRSPAGNGVERASFVSKRSSRKSGRSASSNTNSAPDPPDGDEITYANHSPMQFRTIHEWS